MARAWQFADTDVRTIGFVTVILSNLLLIVVNRSWRLSALQTFRQRRNPTMKWILGITLLVLVLLLVVPSLRAAFGFGELSVLDGAVVVVAALAGVSWFELLKRTRRTGGRA